MPNTAAHLLLDTLHEWGVGVIFGLPGDGINGIMAALRERQDTIRFVQVRHEEAAAFMACAYAKWTGKMGVCLSTSGPGGIHLLNGLYDAKMDGQPVLAITGMPFHDLIGTFTQQDVPLDRLFADVAIYNERIMGPTHVENVADLACRSAIGKRGVAHISFPISFQSMPAESQKPTPRNKPHHESRVPGRGGAIPDASALQDAADVLNTGQKIYLLAGRGALGATDELLQVAETLGAPIGKALLGKAVIPDDNPYTTGSVGYLGTDASQTAFDTCDTLLMVGSSMPYLEYLPKPGKARVVQIDTDPMRIGIRAPTEVGLIGDARATLAALLPLLERKSDRAFLTTVQEAKRQWEQTMTERADYAARPMKPQVVAQEIAKRLRDDAILSSDSGTSAVWWARYIPARAGQMHSVSGLLASMACGLPYANAAAIAYPDRQHVALVGDGGLSMLMCELMTSVKYNLPVKIIVPEQPVLRLYPLGADSDSRDGGVWRRDSGHRLRRVRPRLRRDRLSRR